MQLEETGVHAPGASPPSVLDQSKRVGYPAGLPTTNSQSHPETLTHTASQHPGGAEEERDRSGARSRAPPTSKPKAELKLSRSLSKSDSDLLTCSPTEDATMGSRSESLSNCSIGKKRLEKSPSFASEWDEVRPCDVTGSHSPPRLPCALTPGTRTYEPGLPWFLRATTRVFLAAVRRQAPRCQGRGSSCPDGKGKVHSRVNWRVEAPGRTGPRERQFLEMTCCLEIFGSHQPPLRESCSP